MQCGEEMMMVPAFVLTLNFHSLGGKTFPFSAEWAFGTVVRFPSPLLQKLHQLMLFLHTGWYLQDLERPEFF